MQRRIFLSAGVAIFATGARAAPDPLAGFVARMNAHDMAGFAALFAEDYVNHQQSAAAPPPPPGVSDKQASMNFFAARLAGLPDLRLEVEETLVTATRIAASFVWSGTHLGPLLGVPATGRKLRFTSCDIFAVRGGLFVEHWGMGDIAGQLAQLRG